MAHHRLKRILGPKNWCNVSSARSLAAPVEFLQTANKSNTRAAADGIRRTGFCLPFEPPGWANRWPIEPWLCGHVDARSWRFVQAVGCITLMLPSVLLRSAGRAPKGRMYMQSEFAAPAEWCRSSCLLPMVWPSCLRGTFHHCLTHPSLGKVHCRCGAGGGMLDDIALC